MPKTLNPTTCFPCEFGAQNPSAVATTLVNRPYPRSLAFGGYKWRVKEAPLCKLGPGPNFFSSDPGDVWVDDKGLHLRIRQGSGGQWFASEVVLQRSLGYGTYIFQTNSRVDTLDYNLVAGLFTWDSKVPHPGHHEMDVEFARWKDPQNATNAQFVLQPCSQCPGCANNCSRFQVGLTKANKYLTLFMTWSPGSVDFKAYRGLYWDNPSASALIHQWTRTGTDVPTPGSENVRVNFWMVDGIPPSTGQDYELVVENFLFRPRCAP